MEIKKLYRLNGLSSPTAALLYDEGEEYPVFLESLHNSIMFPELLKSGYSLAGLPYDFVKDGVSIMDLPVEDLNDISDDTMQQMYDLIGNKLTISELSKHIDTSIARGIPIPATQYVIHTRKEFLDYLKQYEAAPMETDFMPINYFVEPQARFTIDEFLNPDNSSFVKIINDRRSMSIKRFHSLVHWLEQNGLSPNASFAEVIDAYFAWGIDGLTEMFVSKKRSESSINLLPGASSFKIDPKVADIITENPYTLYNYTYGLTDQSGKWHLAPEDRNQAWRTDENNPKRYDEFCRSIPIGRHARVKLKAPTTKTVFELQGNKCIIKYSNDTIMITTISRSGQLPVYHTYPTISIPSLTASNRKLPNEYCLPRNKHLLQEYCMIESLAKYIYDIRKDPRQVSSYDALIASGLSAEDAILYILTYAGMITDSLNIDYSSKSEDEGAAVRIPPTLVTEYLNGKRTSDGNSGTLLEEAHNTIAAVIAGELNIDNIAIGKQNDSIVDLNSIYEDIRVINKIIGIPLTEIYNKINARPDNAVEVIFEGNGMTFVMDISKISFAVEGLARDLKMYQVQQANNAIRFYEVIQVAREVCAPGEDGQVIPEARPIGIEYYYVDCNTSKLGKQANGVLDMIMRQLMEEVSNNSQATVQFINKYAQLKRTFAMQAWFEIFHKGYYTLPKDLGSIRKDVSTETQLSIRACTKRAIDSLAAISRSTVWHTYNGNPNSPNRTQFIRFCVNAYVGEKFVIPKAPGATIHEAPIYALWYSWNQEQYAKLRESGAILGTHTPWEVRYMHDMGCRTSQNEYECLDHPQSLMSYFKHADKEVREWQSNVEFKTATHQTDYMYPGLFMDADGEVMEEEPVLIPVPRTGFPVVDVKTGREIDKTTYAKNRLDVTLAERPDFYIRPFIGFDVEVMLSCSDVLSLLPKFGINDIVVLGDNVVFSRSRKIVNFTRLTEDMTPFFKHVSGRFNLLRDAKGDLWEVRL